ncbi:MAG: MBL fold metallo-hydrolase [Kiritimatiellae bacterium]|nr:MBL fold metallo-hydrolase [Kiritimatiellia bacterium]
MSAAVRIVILAENTAEGRGIRGEHGLAFWVETGGRRLLFDAGQGLVLGDNAKALGVDLNSLDAIVLSHGHYDHTGGIGHALDRTARRAISVYAHPDALLPKYRCTPEGVRDVGMPQACREALAGGCVRLMLAREGAAVVPGIRTTGEIPRRHAEEAADERFCLDPEGRQDDSLTDDQSLVIETDEGVVLLLGCAHAGLINTLERVRELTGGRPMRAMIGGTHLRSASAERLAWTMRELRRYAIETMFPMHCTGPRASAAFWQTFPRACHAGGAGSEICF